MTTLTTRCGRCRALLLPVLALLLLAGCSEQSSTSSQEAAMEQAPAAQVAEPVAQPSAAAPEPAPAPEPMAAAEPADSGVDGQKIYQASCQSCHAAGIAGAPKLGDKEAWAPRIAKGEEALLGSVTNGLNAMPPKGACMSCSEDDLRAAVAYMVEQGS